MRSAWKESTPVPSHTTSITPCCESLYFMAASRSWAQPASETLVCSCVCRVEFAGVGKPVWPTSYSGLLDPRFIYYGRP